MPLGRDAKARANMRTDEIQAAAVTRAGEDVESGFEPVIEAMGDFDRFVPGPLRERSRAGLNAKYQRLKSLSMIGRISQLQVSSENLRRT